MYADVARTFVCAAIILLDTLIAVGCKELTYKFGCVWRSSISSTLPEIQEFAPLSSCDHGELHWYYPKGALRTTFAHHTIDSDFSLCLVHTQQNHVTKIYNETSGNGPSSLVPPTLGDETCVPSQGGRVVLNFQAPSQRHRLAVIEYRRQIRQPP